MKKIHFKLSFSIILLLIQGCATNDSNSLLVRFWNDGFIMTEKKSDANESCSWEANQAYPSSSPSKDDWNSIYRKCMSGNHFSGNVLGCVLIYT